jgi:hypothetical protein
MITSKQMQAAARYDTGIAKPEAKPPLAQAPRSPLPGSKWRWANGMIFCGTLRIVKADFDTDPSPEFCKRVFDYICDTLNAAENTKLSSGGPADKRQQTEQAARRLLK